MKFTARLSLVLTLTALASAVTAQEPDTKSPAPPPRLPDAVQDAATPRGSERPRPEQKLTVHDQSGIFKGPAAPSSGALAAQPDEGKVKGFDFSRDPLNSKVPNQDPEEIKKADMAAKAGIMAAQQKLLEGRYDLKPRLHPEAKMSRGIKDSPPYLHDGRCLTLEDTVEFFNLVLQLKLAAAEKTDLVQFLRVL